MDEYETMLKMQRKAKRIMKQNNYREQTFDCCLTCENLYQDCIESALECLLVSGETKGWSVHDITELGICDKFTKKE